MKVAVIHPTGHLFNTPCVPNLAQILVESGFEVKIFSVKNKTAPPGQLSKVTIDHMPWIQKKAKENVALLTIFFFFWLLFKLPRRQNNCLLLASGIRGLFVVGALSLFVPFRFGYYSLELYSGRRFETFRGRLFKWLERKLNKRALFSIVQDEKRAEILRHVNHLGDQPIFTFANAPLRAACCDETGVVNDGREGCKTLKERLGVPSDSGILLYAGSLSDSWACVEKIARMAHDLPDGWILFLQSRMSEGSTLEAALGRMQRETRKIFLSLQPLSVNDYEQLVEIADIGLAWYESEEENIRYVGLSSGKIAQYWAKGKPIIVNRIQPYIDLCPRHKAGVVVSDVVGIPDAVRTISSSYASFIVGARNAFGVAFDVKNEGRRIAKAIADVTAPSSLR